MFAIAKYKIQNRFGIIELMDFMVINIASYLPVNLFSEMSVSITR